MLGTHPPPWEQAAAAWAPLVHGAALLWGGKATAFVLILPAKSRATQTEPCYDGSTQTLCCHQRVKPCKWHQHYPHSGIRGYNY